ncbi:carbamoyltransferase HypF [Helicobacter monodelphidis]|uniref:carbamoyltransferase HypF n=1 Tax=Helicobacter sp. 15-1451 TaxID=2004995 RepID=UPI000DCD023B|nr:carbamoyltransferase HypF [Helicobacter sp. 15-1451]RAX58149.1 carbamoyltransferase HypF [Helicobacter sp. 15-1451]
MMKKSFQIHIQGKVQGVGFRPFIAKNAQKRKLCGFVRNSMSGVEILLQGDEQEIENFLYSIKKDLHPHIQIDSLECVEVNAKEYHCFFIEKSNQESQSLVHIPTDYAMCERCLKEMLDCNNRRFKYPFISCTDCGSRWSLIQHLPYDRHRTTMRYFEMCQKCLEEYHSAESFRFHSQINSCPECGPTLFVRDSQNNILNTPNPFAFLAESLRQGKIIACKGVGGFTLICDAHSKKTIQCLRKRKRRPQKPFAVMFPNLESIREHTNCSVIQEELLQSTAAPIVLLKPKRHTSLAMMDISPKTPYLGAILPYSPLHHLLLREFGNPIIFTSANLSGEPIIACLEDLNKILDVYDLCVDDNRIIAHSIDDSLFTIVDEKPYPLRVGRGFAPLMISTPDQKKFTKPVMGLGAEQKGTIGLGFLDKMLVSPYIGDLKNVESMNLFLQTKDFFTSHYAEPDIFIADKHPSYRTHKMAKGAKNSLFVQHHHAHSLALMAEYGIQEIIGVVFDGSGFGDDGNIWGGEILLATPKKYKYYFSLQPFKLLGGERAIQEPARVLLSLLFMLYQEGVWDMDIPALSFFNETQKKALYQLYQKDLNSPITTSMGRLFDAVAMIFYPPFEVTYDGECGLMLEGDYVDIPFNPYPFEINKNKIYFLDMIVAMLRDRQQGIEAKISITRFFHTIVEMIVKCVEYIFENEERVIPVGLSGGVFCNQVLLKSTLQIFKQRKIPYIIHQKLPSNDGCISLGQLYFGLFK